MNRPTPNIKPKHPVFFDAHGIFEILSKAELFAFLKIKHYLPEDAAFEDYEQSIYDYVQT